MMSDLTTIQISKSVAKELQNSKEHPRQTYNEIISKLVELTKSIREKNQYDEFLHKIQQEKMKELWDNKEDEDWEDA